MIHKLPNGSAVAGQLPKGCEICEEGAKMVLLVTGQCAFDCFYCPLSEEKQGKPGGYANEKLISDTGDIIDEAESIGAGGTGITGGDPLLQITKTLVWLQILKEHFGDGHHAHLYTATADPDKVKQLADAGLDEIRFHPPPEVWASFEDTGYPECIKVAKESGMKAGLEIPTLPDMQDDIRKLIKSAELAGAEFVNLNELEFSETNWRELKARGYEIAGDVASGVKGSEEAALSLLETDTDITLHYCSASFKDGVQLRRRIMRRAERTATPLEIITEDGTFIKGVVEIDEPEKAARHIADEFEIPDELIRFDGKKGRIELAAWILEEIHEDVGGLAYIVEEYPTADRLEVERRPLNPYRKD